VSGPFASNDFTLHFSSRTLALIDVVGFAFLYGCFGHVLVVRDWGSLGTHR
ncbi:hypothetical protein COCVIDRAFT_91663, partial [Bipolaris victoriae FI3]